MNKLLRDKKQVLNFFNFLKNKKGMTLIELVIGCALLAVLMSTVIFIFVPMIDIQIKINEQAELNTLLDNVANPIIKDLSCATVRATNSGVPDEIKITINSPDDVRYIVNSDGILERNDYCVYSKEYYKNKSISFTYEEDLSNGTGYVLTVSIFSDKNDEKMIERDYSVRPLVLNQY